MACSRCPPANSDAHVVENVVHDPIALYPMVEESEAVGTVAAVYAQIVEVMPIVPSVFKSLAVCPPYAARPPDDPQVREALAGFVAPLSQMLLLCVGLTEALAGRLPGEPARGQVPAAAGPVQPRRHVPSAAQTGSEDLYGEIRAALRTPLINSIWRSLAGRGLLGTAWNQLGPQVEPTREPARALADRARRATRQLSWPVLADPVALRASGVAEAAPGIAAILGCYVTTLPRVLTLVACCADQ